MIAILWRLVSYWKRHKLVVSIAFLVVLAGLFFQLATPAVVAYAIDSGIGLQSDGSFSGSESTLLQAALIVVALQGGRGICGYFQSYLGEYLSQHVAYRLRNDLYTRIQSLSFSYHDHSQAGQLMSRVTADVENARLFLDNGLLRMFITFIQFIAVTVIMLALNWKLAILILIAIPVVGYISISTTTMLRPLLLSVQQQMGAYAAVLQESLAGIRVVKAFTAEEKEFKRFSAANWAVREKSIQAARISAFRQPMLGFVLEMINVGILAYGGSLVIGAEMTLGTLYAFTEYRQRLTQPVRQVAMQLQNASRASASAERVFEVLDTNSEVVEKPDAIDLGNVKGEVRYIDVSFGYGKDFPVVQEINIQASPGETVALLGPIGSGKSTILNLLPRFYDATGGSITIDGHDIRDVTLTSLRANVGVVMQDLFLFNASIRDNIAYGRPEATQEEIIAAAKIARLHDFIMGLPEQYDTWVGERGITLSGGQKQRIAIARTLLLDPRILVLDDSTSSVDMETEYLIQQALVDLLKNRTAFVIAHRIRTVRNADQILVLKDGTIVERGNHDELITHGGLYKELYDTQLRDQEELAREAGLAATSEEAS
ncbi:MAG: ATP-binding cassette domain-containing protein [Dehalococcoidia bacterium]|nr:ATP-binding cassette domain-containing protein [Dehalococcoidia bacterium]